MGFVALSYLALVFVWFVALATVGLRFAVFLLLCGVGIIQILVGLRVVSLVFSGGLDFGGLRFICCVSLCFSFLRCGLRVFILV